MDPAQVGAVKPIHMPLFSDAGPYQLPWSLWERNTQLPTSTP